MNMGTPSSLLHMYDPGWPPGFSAPTPDAGWHLLLLLREESRSTLQAPFQKLIRNRPLPAGSQHPSSLAIPGDHWQQTRPHENLKGIPALQKHPEKCQPVLPLPGLSAAWVSALLGSPKWMHTLTSLGYMELGCQPQQCSEREKLQAAVADRSCMLRALYCPPTPP